MRAPLTDLVREWGRIGCLGFGGPPAHIAMLRELCVERRRWLTADEFEDAHRRLQPPPRAGLDPAARLLRVAPARRGRRDRGRAGVHPARAGGDDRARRAVPRRRRAAAGARRRAPAPARRSRRWPCTPRGGSCRRAARGPRGAARRRWAVYAAAGALAAALAGPWLVLVLLAAGAAEVAWRRRAGLAAARLAGLLAARARGGRARRARVGRVQGRRALLRRRLRDHPAHAGRRGRPLRLDDRRRSS